MEEKKVPNRLLYAKKNQWKRESGRIKSGRCKETWDEKLVEKNFR